MTMLRRSGASENTTVAKVGSEQSEPFGFVLPYVLLVIAILAVSTALVAEYFLKTSKLMSAIEIESRADLAFANAEAQTVFSLLKAGPVNGGFDLGGPLDGTQLFLSPEGGVKYKDFWSLEGETRRAFTPQGDVQVTLQDVSGLVNLNLAPPEEISPLLIYLGLSKDKAADLAAKLVDYRDADNSRQFRGAERADYRLRQIPAPTNLPLRNYNELHNIYDWSDALQGLDIISLKRFTTLSQSSTYMNMTFAPPLLRQIYTEQGNASAGSSSADVFSLLVSQALTPSDRIRVTFRYISTEGVLREKAIDIERRESDPAKPFRRYVIYETVRQNFNPETDWLSSTELKNVVYAQSN